MLSISGLVNMAIEVASGDRSVEVTKMDVSRLRLTILRTFAVLIGRCRLGNCRFGDRTIEQIAGTWLPSFIKSSASNPVRVDGHVVYHTGHQSSLRIASGLHEIKTTELVRSFLRPGMTFVDIGAHIGWYTIVAARAVGRTGHVYAFEPEPSNFELLRRNVVVNGYQDRVTLVPKAVCDAPRRVRIFRSSKDSAGSSMYATSGVGTEFVEMEGISLDLFFRERGWPRIDLIKMDIEGAERTVLQGIFELCRRAPDLRLIVEYSPSLLEAAGDTPQQFLDTLEELEFRRVSVISWQPIPVKSLADVTRHAYQPDGSADLLCER